MALHQYIGARYVPKFYQNSLDPNSTLWESNVTYEPMTWVSVLNGNMYLSKKTVPETAGDPASTPEYWMEAGQFNAYIQGLQDQIDDMNDGTVSGSLQNQINEMNDGAVTGSLQNQINEMNDGSVPGSLQNQIDDITSEITDNSFVFIGDSFGTRPNGWINQFKSVLGLSTGVNCWSSAEGGSGFCNPNTFQSLLTNLVSGMSAEQKASVRTLVTVGGVNDTYTAYSQADVANAVKAYCDYARSVFPNLKHSYIAYNCTFASPFMSDYSRKGFQYRTKNGIRDGVKAAGYNNSFIEGLDVILNYTGYVDMNDGVHLTTAGENALAYFVLNAINNGTNNVSMRVSVHSMTFIFTNSGMLVTTTNGDLYNGPAMNISANTYNIVYSGDTTLPYYVRGDLMIPCKMVIVDSSNVPHSVEGVLRLSNNGNISIFSDVAVSNAVRINFSGAFTGFTYFE